jgi:pimeloyl-ACP methyl ester carboxylesterase
VFLVPGLRGNTLIFEGSEYVSGGDPSDAWDGATDDALAFLEAALEVTPEIDREKIAVVGYSRGGTVALLAGIRDPRIDLVLDVVGPVDHLVAMDSHLGWTTGEVLADALRDGTVPEVTEEGGQDFDHFFDRVLEGETLAGVRARLIASSPLYFVEDLPETHSYYGSEDRSVPLANPTLLRARLAELGRLDRDTTLRVFEERGHDTDPLLIQREITRLLTAWAAR